MNQRIIYPNETGGICIIVPAHDCGLSIEQIAKKDVPKGSQYLIVNETDIPADRTYREAWQADFTGALIND